MIRTFKFSVAVACSPMLAIMLSSGLAFYVGITAEPVCAADRFWDSGGVADQNWGTGLNWNTNAVPTSADRAFFNNGGTGQITNTQTIGAITLGNASGESGTLIIGPGGSLSDVASAYTYVGRIGTGSLYLSGGSYSKTTNQLRIGEENGGSGTVYHTGGTLSAIGIVLARVSGSTGRYELSGASSVVNVNTGVDFYVGHQGAGTMVQTDGTVNVANSTYIGHSNGGNGLYQMSGGALNVTGDLRIRENAGSSGNLEISGGEVTATNLVMTRTSGAGTADVTVSGTGKLTTTANAFIAYAGTGVFTQTGGTVKIGGNMLLTNSSTANGTYNLQGGVLDMDGGNITRHATAVSNFNFTGGRLEDVNTFNGNLLQQGGTLAAGNSPGIMNITGDYTLGAAATLEVEIFGDNPTTPEFDQYLVGGNAVLNGTLTLLGNDSFETDLDVFENMFFDVLTADTITIGPTFNLDQSGYGFANSLYELFDYEVVDIGGGQQALRLSLLAVPEPASLLLWGMGGGLAFAAVVYRRQLRKSQKI